ncbi:hypothetical protein RBS94_14225 [Staphylococcus aureus]|nr:hypothetical protein [Staphylococcus aureus]MDV5922444.1 hypothetical protein [Staphylococcus aureus]MDV5932880.1 hypothetical protein [Staphylococcus aureus]MDV5948978.1 hypothetical protein [Staphylococcus aureus]MDV5965189.1 hypothetical protein [Staphylococcus aureus]
MSNSNSEKVTLSFTLLSKDALFTPLASKVSFSLELVSASFSVRVSLLSTLGSAAFSDGASLLSTLGSAAFSDGTSLLSTLGSAAFSDGASLLSTLGSAAFYVIILYRRGNCTFCCFYLHWGKTKEDKRSYKKRSYT